ncbi:MAG TPA: ATP-binding protein [Burkholderiales bacterium]|nr:ATP-binding protein [Burkholderiales bacterium]
MRFRELLQAVTLTRALVGLGVVLVAINFGAAIWSIRAEGVANEQAARRDFNNLTRLLAEQTAASLEAADLVLRNVTRHGNAARIASLLPREGEDEGMPQMAAFLLADRDGRVLRRSSDTLSIDGPVARLDFFRAHVNGAPDRLYIGRPYQGGASGTSWRFILSRRITEPGGTFAGVMAAVIELDRFDRLYRTIDVGDGGFMTLLSMDGFVYARVPDPVGARGRQFMDTQIIDSVRATGRYEGWAQSPVIGQQVLLSSAAVPGFPMFVAAGAIEGAVLAPWRDKAALILLRTILISAAMLTLMALAAWGLTRRERALERNRKRFQAMIEHASDAVIIAHPRTGEALYASPSVARVVGSSPAEIVGGTSRQFFHPEDRERERKLLRGVMEKPGAVATTEIRVRHKDGSWVWVEATFSNLVEDPAVGAIVMNFRDITERKLAEAERGRLEQRLRQSAKMEAVGRLAGGIAHDFNNILGGILGYAEMLVETAPEGSAQRRYAQNVLTAANRASALVEQILSYSRSQRAKRAPVEIDRIAAETLELVRGSLPAGIRLDASLPREALCVVGDATQLHQIVMNLCTNAIHAMGERGVLSVILDAVEVPAERTLLHGTLEAGKYARLMVRDTGEGMDEKTLARVFEPFFTTKEVGKGTGLGLSLVYGIVTDSGGAIEVSSKPGAGSAFAIYLPKVESPVLAPDESAGPVARGAGERILLVDDEAALLAVTTEALKRLGYEPHACADGESALAAFRAAPERFDAVVTDEVMPGITGTELAKALRGMRPALPILLVSGYIGPRISERAADAGVDEILRKPVQSRELAAALARVLKKDAALQV